MAETRRVVAEVESIRPALELQSMNPALAKAAAAFKQTNPTKSPTSMRRMFDKSKLGIAAALHLRKKSSSEEASSETVYETDWDPSSETTKIVRLMQEAVISVAISDDGSMCAAGTVGAKVLLTST